MKKNFKYGAASTVFTVIFLAVLIAVNLIVGLLSERMNLLLDMTSDKRSSISDTTYMILDGLENDVKIYTVCAPEALDSQFSYGTYYYNYGTSTMTADISGFSLSEYMQKYALYSDKIEVEQIDADKDPTFAEKYGITSPYDIVVVSGDRYRTIPMTDLYKLNSTEEGAVYVDGMAVEQTLTNAISYAATDIELKKHAYTVNHNETAAKEYLDLLETAGYEHQTLDMMKGDIPEDVTYITINAPGADFSEEEIKKLQQYVDRGNTTLAVYLYAGVEGLDNLSSFLADAGIGITSGIANVVVDQSDYVGDASAIIADYGETGYTQKLPESMHLIMPWSTPLEIKETHDYSVSPVLYSGDGSFLNDKTANGPFVIAAEAKKHATASGNASNSKILVSTSSMAISDNYINGAGINNPQFTLNCADTGEEKFETAYISTVTFADNYLRMSNNQMRIFSALFVYIIPIGLLACGLAVFIRRKHR